MISERTTGLRQKAMKGNSLAKPNVARKDSIQQDIQMKGQNFRGTTKYIAKDLCRGSTVSSLRTLLRCSVVVEQY